MGGTFHFQEHTGLDAFQRADARDLDRIVGAKPFELLLKFESLIRLSLKRTGFMDRKRKPNKRVETLLVRQRKKTQMVRLLFRNV